MRADGIVGDVVIGPGGTGVYRHGRNDITGEGVDRRSRYDAMRRERPGERGRRERRTPIGVAVVALVVDGTKYLEGVVECLGTRQIMLSPSTENSHGIDPDYRCAGALVRWRRILGSQSRSLVMN